MRNILKLLKVMLNNQHHFRLGLCSWNGNLNAYELISYDEMVLLYEYIEANRPSKYLSWTNWKQRDDCFYWPMNEIKPRIKWIKNHIKKLEKYEKTSRP